MLTHIDLFSGIGGFALAAQWAGFKTVAFVEIEPYAQELIKQNFGAMADDDSCKRDSSWSSETEARATNLLEHGSKLYGDIRTFDGTLYRGATLLTGGFPCQPFSQAGKRRGKEDDRFLWPEMLRVISQARPAWVVGENVAGIVNMELDQCISDLESEGYAVQPLIIPACAVDAKHRRDRVWIVGHASCNSTRNESGTTRVGREGIFSPTGWTKEINNHSRSGEDVADAAGERQGNDCESEAGRKLARRNASCSCGIRERTNGNLAARWLPEPPVGRVAHGIPRRVDRLKGLGNAIVPRVAYQIIKGIADITTWTNK